ncbi:30S ribosomal protein S3 [Candidatus Woesearchaeota archaeon]|nr:30S ribosomal protein S3 [Candidatus Woesearchaeota archaeon]
MIERKIVEEKIKELQIEEYITNNLRNSGHSHTKLQRTPLGEKIIIFASRPGLIVGRKGQNIKKLTQDLKKKFKLENPQIEISEVEDINLDAQIVSERIAASMERYGAARFKGIAHKVMLDAMNSGALGIEIIISGKVPSTRSKSWRFYQGYLKKCGDIALSGVNKAYSTAKLKSGVIGVKVSIMPPTTKLPDDMKIKDMETIEEEMKGKPEGTEEKKKDKKAKPKKSAKTAKSAEDKDKPQDVPEKKAEETSSGEQDVSEEDKGTEKPE